MLRQCVVVLLAAALSVLGANARQTDKAAGQRAAARANLKKAFDKEDMPHFETTNLLVFSALPDKDIKGVAQTLESQIELARKALNMEKETPWPGKLAVYLLADRDAFKVFIRRVERRLPESDEVVSSALQTDAPHVVAWQSKGKLDFGADGLAGVEIAAALLTKKAGGASVEWLRVGFGRATVVQSLPKNEQAIQHGKAKVVLQKKVTARDVYTGNVRNADEATILRASLVEYLAYSGKTQVFPEFVAAFRPRGENLDQFPSVDDSLKAVNVAPDQLNSKWQAWVKFSP